MKTIQIASGVINRDKKEVLVCDDPLYFFLNYDREVLKDSLILNISLEINEANISLQADEHFWITVREELKLTEQLETLIHPLEKDILKNFNNVADEYEIRDKTVTTGIFKKQTVNLGKHIIANAGIVEQKMSHGIIYNAIVKENITHILSTVSNRMELYFSGQFAVYYIDKEFVKRQAIIETVTRYAQ